MEDIISQDWDKTPESVRRFIESQIPKIQEGAKQNERLISKLKQKYFPNSTFIGPYEKEGIVHGVVAEQWLWQFRHLVKGEVLDMSTPLYWNAYLREQPSVTKWLISDLCAREVSKLGYTSPVDIVGDFCATPPPLSPRSLDTILCISILEHCKDPMAMVRNLADILRPGGVVFFLMPFAYIDGHMSPDYWRFCRDGYKLLAAKANLEIIEIGELVDLGKYFLLEFGWSAEATSCHQGIPFNNYMICRRKGN